MASSDHPLARHDDIAPGTTLRVERDGDAILLCNVEGTIYAVEDVCSHDGGELDQGELDGCRIECPRHGAYFDVTTGAALTLPAIVPIRKFPVAVRDGAIFIEG